MEAGEAGDEAGAESGKENRHSTPPLGRGYQTRLLRVTSRGAYWFFALVESAFPFVFYFGLPFVFRT